MPEELGKYLESARTEKGLSAVDVADISRVNIRFIHAAEKGQFVDLPGNVFIRGLLRSYGTILSIDGDDLIRRYDELNIAPHDRSPELISMPLHAEQAIPSAVIGSLLGGLALVVIVAVYYYFGSATMASFSQLAMVSAPQTAKEATVAEEAATPIEIREEIPDTNIDAPLITPVPSVSPTKMLTDADRLGDRSLPHELRLTALSDAWIKVLVDDEIEREIILRQGNTVRWWASEKFRLSLGNVAGTTIHFDGEKINLLQPKSNILTNLKFPSEHVTKVPSQMDNR